MYDDPDPNGNPGRHLFRSRIQQVAKVSSMKVRFKKLDERAAVPAYARPGDAGMDLSCLERFVLAPGQRRLIPTGLGIAIEDGFEAQVRARSGNAFKKGVTVLNSPGTIDAGYRGEVGVLLVNHSLVDQEFMAGDRIAQLVVAPVAQADIEIVDELPESVRGTHGYGSSGN